MKRANGNLTEDLNKNITTIQYNYLNLPSKITFGDGSTIAYLYGADGTKFRTTHTINGTVTTTDYCDNVIYENGTATRLLTEAGYVSLNDNKYNSGKELDTLLTRMEQESIFFPKLILWLIRQKLC
ncbi:MAG: repeat-associated core domain [Bacteroidetes bacterium]|nr:repeat-associated core domain [Bacteroidota bacterium]